MGGDPAHAIMHGPHQRANSSSWTSHAGTVSALTRAALCVIRGTMLDAFNPENYDDTVSANSTVLGSALSLRFDDPALEHGSVNHALKTAPCGASCLATFCIA